MSAAFVKTDTVLDQILAHKALEIRQAYWDDDENRVDTALMAQVMDAAARQTPARDFVGALRSGSKIALIAEVKKASPSKGVLIEDFDPVALGTTYAAHGAAALSVLTDERFFQGHLRYLREVRAAVAVPVLRKEFIIDPLQIYEARAANADAILLIVAALEDAQLADLHRLALELGMAALVEVHNEAELERALKIGAALIGVNNRDLKTFHEDLNTTGRLAKLMPPGVTIVAESAMRSVEHVRRMGELGAHAVLVGEGLVKSGNIARTVQMFSSQPR